MTSLEDFQKNINSFVSTTEGFINDISKNSSLFTSLEIFNNDIITLYTGEGKENIGDPVVWDRFKGNSDSTTIDKTSVIYQFKEWANKAGTGSEGELTWEDINDSRVWDVSENKENFESTISPTGSIYRSTGLSTAPEIDNINVDKINKHQLNKMLYELIYLDYIDTPGVHDDRETYVRGTLLPSNSNFAPFPDVLDGNSNIKSIKKEIIRLYAMVKSRFNESDVELGIILENI